LYFNELPRRGLVGAYIKFVMFILTAGPMRALHDHRYVEQYLYPLRCPPDERRLEEVGACALRTCVSLACAAGYLRSCDSQVIASTSHISICPFLTQHRCATASSNLPLQSIIKFAFALPHHEYLLRQIHHNINSLI